MKQTNWIVFTGAPSSGKTTQISILRKMGFSCTDETARAVISNRIDDNTFVGEDDVSLQMEIFNRQFELETSLDTDALIILDRALPDTIAYLNRLRVNCAKIQDRVGMFRYAKVFHFGQLQVVEDGLRNVEHVAADYYKTAFYDVYQSFGYDVVNIDPYFECGMKVSIEKRTRVLIGYIRQIQAEISGSI